MNIRPEEGLKRKGNREPLKGEGGLLNDVLVREKENRQGMVGVGQVREKEKRLTRIDDGRSQPNQKQAALIEHSGSG